MWSSGATDLVMSAGSAVAVSRYFALDHSLDKICRTFPADDTMAAARKFCRGLRIIRQPVWECLASFICSSVKQVAHIRQMTAALRQRFGVRRPLDRLDLFVFPSADAVARCSEADLRGCGLGYRAGNLLATARLVVEGRANLAAWRALPDEELHNRLRELPGVGPKVANCVQLFAYERLRAFPIDVWIERVLRSRYFPRRRKFKPGELRDFSASYFGPYGGYAQQYLFHYARLGARAAVRPARSRRPPAPAA